MSGSLATPARSYCICIIGQVKGPYFAKRLQYGNPGETRAESGLSGKAYLIFCRNTSKFSLDIRIKEGQINKCLYMKRNSEN